MTSAEERKIYYLTVGAALGGAVLTAGMGLGPAIAMVFILGITLRPR